MIQASVGFQCPDCVHQGRATTRQPRRRSSVPWSATLVIIALPALMWLVDLLFDHTASLWMTYSAPLVQAGEVWRVVTYLITPASALSVLINGVFLWFIGRQLEERIGTGWFVALWLTGGIGGATLLQYVAPGQPAGGSAITIIGLLAVNAVLNHRAHADIRGDLVLLAMLLAFSLVLGGQYWVGQLGSILAAAAGAWLMTDRSRSAQQRKVMVAGLVGVLLAAIAVNVVVF